MACTNAVVRAAAQPGQDLRGLERGDVAVAAGPDFGVGTVEPFWRRDSLTSSGAS